MTRCLEMNHRSNVTYSPALLCQALQHDLNEYTVIVGDILGCMSQSALYIG